jgi:hypothetical protein
MRYEKEGKTRKQREKNKIPMFQRKDLLSQKNGA